MSAALCDFALSSSSESTECFKQLPRTGHDGDYDIAKGKLKTALNLKRISDIMFINLDKSLRIQEQHWINPTHFCQHYHKLASFRTQISRKNTTYLLS